MSTKRFIRRTHSLGEMIAVGVLSRYWTEPLIPFLCLTLDIYLETYRHTIHFRLLSVNVANSTYPCTKSQIRWVKRCLACILITLVIIRNQIFTPCDLHDDMMSCLAHP
jgi:hypothetical protein